jgi:hypothetical protein
MSDFPADIYTEPDADVHTLNNLGPLTCMAGIWKGIAGDDLHPAVGGARAPGLHRAVRAATDRPADERPAAALRASLPHAARQARLGRDVP